MKTGIVDIGFRVNSKEFGVRLRLLREAKGLNQRELADRMAVTAAAIGNWEQGTRRPQFPEEVVKLAAVLGIDVAELLVVPEKRLVKKSERGPGRPKKPEE